MLDYKGWVDNFFDDRSVISIIEVGVYKGDFAVRLLNAARFASPHGKIIYTGIDLFESLDNSMLLQENSLVPPPVDSVYNHISKECPFASVKLHCGDSAHILPKLSQELSRANLIYIDAGHSVNSIATDWTTIQTIAPPEALIIFDDYYEGRLDCGAKAVVDVIDLNIWEVELTRTRSCETRIGVVDLRQALVRQRQRFRQTKIIEARNVILEPIDDRPRSWIEETQETLKLITNFISKKFRVCDIGCGVGRISLPLSRYVAHVDGVDSSPEMLKLLMKQDDAKSINNLTIFSTDKWLTMTEKRGYDLVIALYVFQHVPLSELDKLLDGISQHANPNAKLLVVNTPNRYIPVGDDYFDDGVKVRKILNQKFGEPEVLSLDLLGDTVSNNHFGHIYRITNDL